MTAVETLTVDELDCLIALTHADITWHSETIGQRIWDSIDTLLDRRNELVKLDQPSATSRMSHK